MNVADSGPKRCAQRHTWRFVKQPWTNLDYTDPDRCGPANGQRSSPYAHADHEHGFGEGSLLRICRRSDPPRRLAAMSKTKRPTFPRPEATWDWTGVRTLRAEHDAAAVIFAQGDPCSSVLHVDAGTVRLSVLSHAGKEAVVAVITEGQSFGEGCLVGQSQRMATATALTRAVTVAIEQPEMRRQLRAQPELAEAFMTHMLTRNIRIEEDLIDQMFNSTEKRLARTLLLLARYGEPEATHRALPSVARTPGGDGRHPSIPCQPVHEQVQEARVHRIQRRVEDQQLVAERGPARLISRRVRFVTARAPSMVIQSCLGVVFSPLAHGCIGSVDRTGIESGRAAASSVPCVYLESPLPPRITPPSPCSRRSRALPVVAGGSAWP